jgi:hypothetical protein
VTGYGLKPIEAAHSPNMAACQSIEQLARERMLRGGEDHGVAFGAGREQHWAERHWGQPPDHQDALACGIEVSRPGGRSVRMPNVRPSRDAQHAHENTTLTAGPTASHPEVNDVADPNCLPDWADQGIHPTDEPIVGAEDG